ncbi:MAG: hypothetical protein CMJ19_14005 [Phycisphaeraceae bacterium]|mgnify:CR=1 FL=1|nr:hypothetical protein [Phycisphaeraceae bacterium]
MAQTLRLKRFSNVALLKRIDNQLLLEFLAPYRAFLSDQRGMPWPDDPKQLDHAALADILMKPGVDTPDRLLDALYFVDGLADANCYDRILQEADDAGIELGTDELSPEDLTLRIWLYDPDILERVHAEQYRVKPKTFQSFYAVTSQRPDLQFPTADVLSGLEDELNEWFDFKKKGRGSRVFPFSQADGFWFLVRHGQQIKREGTVESNGESGSVFYRPEKFDVLIYYPHTGELAIFTETKGERKTYCKLFGKHLFGDEFFFAFDPYTSKYSLTPLITDGRSSLVCSDVGGISKITLYELHIQHQSAQKDIEIRRADDVFQSLIDHHRVLQDEQESTSLIKAKFRVAFDGGRERSITITPPNIASFDRENDNWMINEWLTKRGFVIRSAEESDATVSPVLEVA